MIDIRELKINNLVSFRGKEIKIIGVRNDNDIPNILFRDGDRTMALAVEEAEPIPLTPDWVKKCGFETPDGYQETVLYNEIMIDYHLGEYKLRDKPKAQLKYLHQLQNVFYSLIGKELEITNP